MEIKKIKGVKRFILVDSLGIPLHARVEPANVSEKQGAKNLLSGLEFSSNQDLGMKYYFSGFTQPFAVTNFYPS